MEANVQAFSPGIYPRSEELVQATRDLDRGRTTREAVEEQVARDLERLVEAQRGAGMDLLSDGMLRWQDLFRPLVEASDGLEPGPLTRFLDTNTFYRAPQSADGPPRLARPLDERFVAPLPGSRLVTLPSPFALALGSRCSPREVAEGVLRPQLEALDADLVVLSEPFLAHEPDPDLDQLAEALAALAGGPPLALQLAFSDAAPLLERKLAELPVDGVGIDFYATRLSDVAESFEGTLLAGVVDTRSSLLEDPSQLAGFAAQLGERGFRRIALVPNGDLQFVSEPIAREKLARLGRAKTATLEVAA
jgi:5-methyltetrahydropteroyltriglutamate--homocysteine methyltransferase